MTVGRIGRLVGLTLALGLIIASGSTLSPAGARGGRGELRILAAKDAIDGLREALELSAPTVASLDDGVAQVERSALAAYESIGLADADLRVRERELDQWLGQANDLAARVRTRALEARPPASVQDLAAPLETVSNAIHSSDQVAVELVRQREIAHRQQLAVRQLETSIRLTQFRIAGQRRLALTRLAEATRSTHLLGEGAGEARGNDAALLAEARAQLHALDIADLELRQVEAHVLQLSTAIADRQGELRRKMGEVRRTLDGFYGDMAGAESLVAAWLRSWSGPFRADLPVVEGVLRVCPVDEPHAYSDDWGAPRWSGGFHLHQGNDIFAPAGTPIRAPFDGTAVVADNSLGGMAVTVLGKTGYVYNAHLSAYGALGPVTAGTVIGYVGNTGDAVSSPPHDHFEWHPGNGEAVDPFPYLNAVC